MFGLGRGAVEKGVMKRVCEGWQKWLSISKKTKREKRKEQRKGERTENRLGRFSSLKGGRDQKTHRERPGLSDGRELGKNLLR